MPNTYFEARKWAFSYIEEADVNLILMTQNKWSYSQLILHLRDMIPNFTEFEQVVLRVHAGEPVQYVLQQAQFFGRDFYVDNRVLIPRLETEELVELILNEQPKTPLNVLDIGTGSSAIATTLKAERANWKITAADISADALVVAKKNALLHDVEIKFVLSDVFSALTAEYDIIVSNPPYIAHSETKIMDKNVLNFEPHLALFAEHQGLAIYETIAKDLGKYLKPGGAAYLEIGLHQGLAVSQLMQSGMPTAKVDIIKDLSGHDRIIRVMTSVK